MTTSSPLSLPTTRPTVVIVGTGSIGERHLRCFAATGRAQVIACEANEALGRAVAQRYNCPWVRNLEEARAIRDITAAVICTPAHLHLPIAHQALDAGWHTLIEKPLAVSSEGVSDLATKAETSKRLIRVAYTLRSHPLITRLRERLGEIGEVRHFAAVSGQHFPTFRPSYREIYYARHESGGGAIQDALTHHLHAIHTLLGRFISLQADAANQVLDGVEVEDCVNLHARLEGGILASFSLNQFQAPNETFWRINGTRGSFRVDFNPPRLGLWLHGDEEWSWEDAPVPERDTLFIHQANAFLDALEGKPDSLATLEEGAHSLQVNLAALQSVRTHQEVRL